MIGWADLFFIFIMGLYSVTMGYHFSRIKMVKFDPVNIVAGLLGIISPFLPWVSIEGALSITVYGQPISSQLVGSLNLPALIELADLISSSPFLQQYAPSYANLIYVLRWGCILTLILLVIGGITVFFKGIIGGILSLIGILLFTVVGGNFYQGIMLNVGFIYTSLSIGYFLAWVGCLTSFASYIHHLRKRAPAKSLSQKSAHSKEAPKL